MEHLNAGVNADADTDANAWASAIALWDQGPAELKMVQIACLLGTQASC